MTRCVLEHSKGLLDRTIFSLEREATIGRSSQNSVCLADGLISRYHARLVLDGGQWVLSDLRSQNGTFVNGERVVRHTLRHGDAIRVGETTLRFLEIEEPAGPSPLLQTQGVSSMELAEEIQEQMDLVKAFLDALPIGIAIINERMEVRYFNGAAASFHAAASPREGDPLGSFVGCEHLEGQGRCCGRGVCSQCPLLAAVIQAFSEGASSASQEMTVWARDPRKARVLLFSIAPLPFRLTGEVLAQVSWEDITHRKEAQRALQDAHDKLEQRVRERTEGLARANAELEKEVEERKRAEAALAESHETLLTVLDSIDADIYVADLRSYEILFMNKHMMDSFGHGLVGRLCWEVFRGERGPCPHCSNPRLLDDQGQPTSVYIWESLNPVTNKYYLNYDRAIRWVNGKFVRLQVAMDITEKKRREDELQKAAKLESIGVLAGGIAHDFNNILAAMLGNISLAKHELRPTDRLFGMLDTAEKATARAAALTRQLLTFAKGGAPVKRIARVQEIVTEPCEFALRGSKSRCEFSVAEGVWTARVDPAQIAQVMHNLVINADQAMPQGGVVDVSAENFTLTEPTADLPLEPGPYLRITVGDHGVGIPQEALPKIFDPYFTTKAKGSGLGLATVYSILKRHEGHVAVESRPGQGSTFTVYLPACSGDEPPEQLPGELAVGGSGRVLVMDDEAMVRETAAKMLRRLGYDVVEAAHGQEAVRVYREALAQGAPFRAVILDLTVPGAMGGKQAVQELMAIDPKVTALVSSGYSNDPVLADYGRYGFKGAIEKPFVLQEIDRTLRQALASEQGAW
jgi:signal transduction histidine kinase/CheY-like chemotaxis protein